MASYDPNTDYSDLIAAEAAKGVNANRQLLEQLEASRNAKIAAERLPYAQTAVYTSELGRPLGYYEATDRSDYINEIYDTAREQALSALESAYESALGGYDAAKAAVPGTYRAARNAAAGQAALTRQSVNEQFAASGLSSGAAGQARLSLAVAAQNALSSLSAEEVETLSAIELERAGAEAKYRAAVAEAIASSERERASALYAEAVRVENSYRAYSEELLAAWGLTPAGTPVEQETAPAAGAVRRTSAPAAPEPEPEPEPQSVDQTELLRRQLSTIPGLTRENKAFLIRDYFADGRISYEDMQELLSTV